MGHTPTANDLFQTESVDIATDLAALLHEFRERVGPEEAYGLVSRVLTLSGELRKARLSVTTEKAREHFGLARTVCLRALIALERFATRCDVPFLRSVDIHRRLSSLALALGALSDPPHWA